MEGQAQYKPLALATTYAADKKTQVCHLLACLSIGRAPAIPHHLCIHYLVLLAAQMSAPTSMEPIYSFLLCQWDWACPTSKPQIDKVADNIKTFPATALVLMLMVCAHGCRRLH